MDKTIKKPIIAGFLTGNAAEWGMCGRLFPSQSIRDVRFLSNEFYERKLIMLKDNTALKRVLEFVCIYQGVHNQQMDFCT